MEAGTNVSLSKHIQTLLKGCDLRVATLETAVGEYDEIDDIKSPQAEVAVWSKYSDLHKLADLNINIVSLANNHACDCGVNAMLRLKENLCRNGIFAIGGGHTLFEAMQPAIFKNKEESIAIISCCKDDPKSLGTLHFASENEGGIYRLDEKIILPQITQLKQRFNHVAVVVHWGIEHRWLPELEDVEIAKKMIDAGADMIIGGHPHHIQPCLMYRNRPICYSLGNFHFPDFCLNEISNVYYPDEKETDQLPQFDWMAPERRNFSMRYFWKYFGRLGMMAIVKTKNNDVILKQKFSIYNNGKISNSFCQFIHRWALIMFSHFVGKRNSVLLNYYISRVNHIVEYKLLALFVKKYDFWSYMKKQS